jgi:hypothetical protein
MVSTSYAESDIWHHDFQAAKVAILTLVSMNEKAWSCAYGEDEVR